MALSAADVSGKWTAEIPGRDGTPQQTTFELQVEGEKLSDRVSTAQSEREILDGLVKGDEITFSTVIAMGSRQIRSFHTG